jgi:hypothetical protein
MMAVKELDDICAGTSRETARDLDSSLPIQEASYKGWLIRYSNRGEWSAELFEPGCDGAAAAQVVASSDEGEAVLIQRAQYKIDSAAKS